MTSLVIEQFPAPDSDRKARVLECSRRRAIEPLAGRTVWCITAAPTGTSAADHLQHCLQAVVDDGVLSHRASLQLAEPLLGLVEHLDGMLRGTVWPAGALGPAAEDVYLRGSEDGESLIPHDVHSGDVVVLHDPIAAPLARPIRERGAHAIWRASIGPWDHDVAAAWRFVHDHSPTLDAYVMTWRSARGGIAGSISGFISASGVVAAKELARASELAHSESEPGADYTELGWTTLLADIVRADRADRVGGRLSARPSVAAR